MVEIESSHELLTLFSYSTNRAVESVGDLSAEVTGARLVLALAQVHPEYGEHRLGKAVYGLDPADGAIRSIGDWLRGVAAHYPTVTERSPTRGAPGGDGRIHGRQVVLGLVELEPALRVALEPTGVLDAIRRELARSGQALPVEPAPGAPDDATGGEHPEVVPSPAASAAEAPATEQVLTTRSQEWLRVAANLLGSGAPPTLDGSVVVCVALVWGLRRPETSRLCAAVLDRLVTAARRPQAEGAKAKISPSPARERERYVEGVLRRADLRGDPFRTGAPEDAHRLVADPAGEALVRDAAAIGARTTGDGRTHSRQLLAAAVTDAALRDADVTRVFGVDHDTLARLVIDTIGERYPQEPAWRDVLTEWQGRARVEEPSEQRSVGHVPLLHDQPATTDRLGRWALASEVAALIDRLAATDDRPEAFALHLDAPWGAGKSTVVEFLTRLLRDPSRPAATGGDQPDRWVVVALDAWRSSQLSPAWWALLGHLRQGVRDDLGFWGRRRFDLALLARECRRLWRLWVPVAVVVGILGILLWVRTDLSGVMATVTSVVAFLTLVGGLGSRFVSLGSLQGARLHERLNDNPMDEVAAQVAAIRRQSPRPILLVLDDLDRCNERFTVELLDAVQTLLRTPVAGHPARHADRPRTPALVVLAVGDHRWLRAAYEHAYAVFTPYVSEPGRPLGHLFLDKLFQVRIELPALGPDQVRSYLGALLRPQQGGPTAGATDPAGSSELLADMKRRIRAAPEQGAGAASVDQTLADILYEDGAALAPEQRSEAVREALDVRRSEDVRAAAEQHMLEVYGDLLEPNPRAAKRFLMAYNLALAARFAEYQKVDPATLALWVVLATRWPALADWIRDQLPRGPLRPSEDGAHPSRLLLTPEVQAVLTSDRGGPLDVEKVLRCLGLPPPEPGDVGQGATARSASSSASAVRRR